MDTLVFSDEKICAAQVLFDEIDSLAREESKLSFVASEIFEKYFAEEISSVNRRDIRLHYEILLDYVFNIKEIIHALSAASCGKL